MTRMKFVAKSHIITLRVQQTWALLSNIFCKIVLDSIASKNVSFSDSLAFYCIIVHDKYLIITWFAVQCFPSVHYTSALYNYNAL